MNELDNPQRRATDNPGLNVRFGKEVPLWSVLTLIVIAVSSSVSLQIGQNEQGHLLREQTDTIKTMDQRIANLQNSLNDAKIKGVEFDFKFADIERRLRALENMQQQRKDK